MTIERTPPKMIAEPASVLETTQLNPVPSRETEPEYEDYNRLVWVSIENAESPSDIPPEFQRWILQLNDDTPLKIAYFILLVRSAEDIDSIRRGENSPNAEQLRKVIGTTIDSADTIADVPQSFRELLVSFPEGDELKKRYFDFASQCLNKQHENHQHALIEAHRQELDSKSKAIIIGRSATTAAAIRTPQVPSSQPPVEQSA